MIGTKEAFERTTVCVREGEGLPGTIELPAPKKSRLPLNGKRPFLFFPAQVLPGMATNVDLRRLSEALEAFLARSYDNLERSPTGGHWEIDTGRMVLTVRQDRS